jgi:hypothetical protein
MDFKERSQKNRAFRFGKRNLRANRPGRRMDRRDRLPIQNLTRKDAYEHVLRWFETHAQQRLTCINYFLAALSLLVAGYSQVDAGSAGKGLSLCVAGVFVCLIFYRLERRNRQLVKQAEDALAPFQREMARVSAQSVCLIQRAEQKDKDAWSYGLVMEVLCTVAALGFSIGIFIHTYQLDPFFWRLPQAAIWTAVLGIYLLDQ